MLVIEKWEGEIRNHPRHCQPLTSHCVFFHYFSYADMSDVRLLFVSHSRDHLTLLQTFFM